MIKENQISVKKFRAFSCVGRYKNLSSLRLITSFLLINSRAIILCFHENFPPGITMEVVAGWWLLDGRHSSWSSNNAAATLWLSLFSLLIWHGIFHLSVSILSVCYFTLIFFIQEFITNMVLNYMLIVINIGNNFLTSRYISFS